MVVNFSAPRGFSALHLCEYHTRGLASRLFSGVDFRITWLFPLALALLILPGPRSLFKGLVLLNLSGLAPLLFPVRTWAPGVVFTGFTLWSVIVAVQLKNTWKGLLTHFTPAGAPIPLAPFLVCIELISFLIRPLTLTLRLLANLTVGHIICALLCRGLVTGWSLGVAHAGYTLFEFGVRRVQAYVFFLLLSLYRRE